MRRSNTKFSFDPGFSITKKILTLAVLGCFLAFFSLVYAGEEFDPSAPWGEHPWDDLQSGDHRPPEPFKRCDVIIFPYGDFGRRIIIHFPQVKQVDKDRIQIDSSDPIDPADKIQVKFFIF
ncbi:MAG: hypothetical protein KAW52_01145 [candidate division Zixibacteria bacterium]|nr:hypothetical protein [candidate division Zixibacteria bacterium]